MYAIIKPKDSERLVRLMCKLVGAKFEEQNSYNNGDTWDVTLLGKTKYLTDTELIGELESQTEIFILFPRNTDSTKLQIFCEDLSVEINLHDGLKMEDIVNYLKFRKCMN